MIRVCVMAIVAGVVLASCMDPITDLECTPVPFSLAEQRGDTIVTTTGLRYIQLEEGSDDVVEWCRMVAVHYTGSLLDGTQFASSRGATPLAFTPGFSPLLTGFEQGVIGMRVGGVRRLIIPPHLGYGAQAQLNDEGEVIVPANSVLVYDIEVLEVAG